MEQGCTGLPYHTPVTPFVADSLFGLLVRSCRRVTQLGALLPIPGPSTVVAPVCCLVS